MRERLRSRVALLAGRVPRFVIVGDRDPQRSIRVMLDDAEGSLDVTRNHVIISLQPLRIAIGSGARRPSPGTLRFTPAGGSQLLGEISLQPDGDFLQGNSRLQFYRVERHLNHCMSFPASLVYSLYHGWSGLGHQPDFQMDRAARLAFEVLYICPRPAVLVSVEHEGAGTLFPMDLIGPVTGDLFLMALKSTSRSIDLMRAAGRMSLADMPVESSAQVGWLGGEGKRVPIDWTSLPFTLDHSPLHGFRVPAAALRVRDVTVRATYPAGSHTLFVTEVVGENRKRDGLQMTTISGPWYRYLRRHGVTPVQP